MNGMGRVRWEGAKFMTVAICFVWVLPAFAVPPTSADPPDTPIKTAEKIPTISLDVSGADVRDIVSALASNFKVNVALPPDLAGTVTVVLKDIGLREALKAVLDPLGYEWEMRESVIYVRKKGEGTRLQASFDAGKLMLDAQRAPLQDVARLLSSMTAGNVVVDETVRDIPVTISVKDIDLGEGLRLLATSHKLDLTEDKGTFLFKKKSEMDETQKEMVAVDSEGLVSVRAQKSEIAAILTQLASKTGVSVGIEQGVSGQVTADLKYMKASEAIGTLAELAGMNVEEKGGVYQVFKPEGAAGGAGGEVGGGRREANSETKRSATPPPAADGSRPAAAAF